MFEFGLAVVVTALAAALLISFRSQRSMKRQLDRLILDHNLLANRVLMQALKNENPPRLAFGKPREVCSGDQSPQQK